MKARLRRYVWLAFAAVLGVAFCLPAAAAIDPLRDAVNQNSADLAPALRQVAVLTALSLLPALLIAMTSFTRIVIVLSMLRTALGLQQTPPNAVVITLSLFLTLFSMMPVLQSAKDHALDPWLANGISTETAVTQGFQPFKEFMIRQTREGDLRAVVDMAGAAQPKSLADVQALHLIPAFMLSELRTAFQIGFVIFLPFLLIDLVVAAILMALGMIMVPPATVSLPLKVLLFLLINGWVLVAQALLGSYRH
ncbi:flagellar type III secretion system pore protein FliP [Dyella marensis]|uniref:flagellar type III secretion system pore protein FliP n=1 Tax=Dyella TaxID=231454 RepID=UPI00144650D5|nr:flagellar type III secretion system pore protein FliP [Dyella sp. SG609]NKJ20343.1 flagellar biosynthetic protein FliP [Dyella sp. SG609]